MARRPKPSKAEKVNRAIERWEHKQEAAVIMLRKSAEELLKLRRQRKRMLATAQIPRRADPGETVLEDAVADFKASAAAEVETVIRKAIATDTPIPLEKLGETDVGKANAESWKQIPAVANAKPKRQRKPKAPPGSTAAGLLAQDDRAKRMEALGFRKTTKRLPGNSESK
jgi:hypothetical protein